MENKNDWFLLIESWSLSQVKLIATLRDFILIASKMEI